MTLLDELKARDVHREGHFALTSGRHAEVFLQCTLALQDPTFARRIGRQLADQVDASRVDVVATPGISSMLLGFVVAEALGRRVVYFEERDDRLRLRRGQRVAVGAHVLIVEDVLTTGRSALEAAAALEAAGAHIGGWAAMVDRSTPDHPLPFEPVSLLAMPLRTYLPADCPLCAADVPLEDPSA